MDSTAATRILAGLNFEMTRVWWIKPFCSGKWN